MTDMKDRRMYVVPTDNLKVFDVIRRDMLPPEGREVKVSNYWLRRVKVGDCVLGKPAAKTQAPKPQPKKESKKQEPKEGDK